MILLILIMFCAALRVIRDLSWRFQSQTMQNYTGYDSKNDQPVFVGGMVLNIANTRSFVLSGEHPAPFNIADMRDV